MNEGELFPDFALPDQDGTVVTLDDLLGSMSIVYFYPKDDTSGCTAEACEFQEAMPRFEGAKVVGVSPDSPKSHRKFREKYSLGFTLLADENKELIGALGLWVEKKLYGKPYMGVARTTYLVDETGKILRIWRQVKPEGHAAEVLAALK